MKRQCYFSYVAVCLFTDNCIAWLCDRCIWQWHQSYVKKR